MKRLLLLLMLVTVAGAQTTPRTITAVWKDTANPVGTTYNVYRAPGICSATSVFTQIASALSVLTYSDTAAPSGPLCYEVSAVAWGVESSKVAGNVTTNPPTSLTVTAH